MIFVLTYFVFSDVRILIANYLRCVDMNMVHIGYMIRLIVQT